MKKEKNIPKGVNGYSFMHGWFNYLRDNYSKVNTYHSALYMYIVHRANTLGWVKEIGLPTDFTFQRAGFANDKTYRKYLEDLINFGLIKSISKSTNQHVATIVSLVEFPIVNSEASSEADTQVTAKSITMPTAEATSELYSQASNVTDVGVDGEASTALLNSKNIIKELNTENSLNKINIEKDTIDLNTIEGRLESQKPFTNWKELEKFIELNNIKIKYCSKTIFENLNFAKGSIELQIKYITELLVY
jgi:hypothetical protein